MSTTAAFDDHRPGRARLSAAEMQAYRLDGLVKLGQNFEGAAGELVLPTSGKQFFGGGQVALLGAGYPPFAAQEVAVPGLDTAVFGVLLVAFILFEPRGLYGRWLKIRTYFELFPFYRRDMFRRQKSYLKTERMR